MTRFVHNQKGFLDWSVLGIKFGYMVAGFFGGVISLRYIKDLNWWQGSLAVVTGVGSANYLTPVVQHFLGMPPALENGAAFLVGFISLNLLAGIMRKSEQWKENPTLPGEPK